MNVEEMEKAYYGKNFDYVMKNIRKCCNGEKAI